MTITVTGKLNKPANEFQAGESIGFGLRLGEQYYDRETKQKEWTNYECVVFAKASAQVDFYRQALVAGSVVQISGKQAKIKTFDGQNGQVLSIELVDASVGYIGTTGAPAQQANQIPPNAHSPAPQVEEGFDDDINF